MQLVFSLLLPSLYRDKSNPFGDFAICTRDGNAYISFGQWVGAIVLYTYVFQMLAPPPGGSFDIVDSNLPLRNPPKIQFPPEEVPLLTHEHDSTNQDTPKDGTIKQFMKFLYDKLKLKQILQPPIIASICEKEVGYIENRNMCRGDAAYSRRWSCGGNIGNKGAVVLGVRTLSEGGHVGNFTRERVQSLIKV
ncbi:hypothetical protein L2E82_17261 [Cichorium intybus]|uniref:Uncharacterized protein n=1 Tax=Cichorium intybus TaxID=13427 RepID=A0ACB9F7E9_CICIN|nr:hypothetical protein L2E82_17261 [Cichorium intybus]